MFGLFKQLHHRTKVGSTDDIAKMPEDSEDSAVVNVAQLVSTQEGETLVPACNWVEFFAPYFDKLVGIKKYHHFRFTSDVPGAVFVKQFSDSMEVRYNLLTDASWRPAP